MIIVGLTGGFGCGKSSVVTELNSHVFVTAVDSDLLAKQIMISDDFRPTLLSIFGSTATTPDGKLNTKELAKTIFNDKEVKQKLEDILYPLVWEEVERRQEEAEKKGKLMFVIESAVLFELKTEKYYDVTVCISCSEETQRRRLKDGRGFTDEEIDARLSFQMPLKEKEKKADVVFCNELDSTGINVGPMSLHCRVNRLLFKIIPMGWHLYDQEEKCDL